MALTSPGVEVTIIDESQYLPAAIGSVPLVVIATAQNKANASGTGVAVGTTAANAGKLYQVTSQRDLVNLYGTPFFYTTTAGTPIQGYELNEYGLLAAYSVLGVSNRCYVLRANIDLASLVGKTGRPTGAPANGTYWLDTTASTWGIYVFSATTGQFTLQTPIVISDPNYLTGTTSGGYPIQSLGNIGDYAVNAIPEYAYPSSDVGYTYFYKTTANEWANLGGSEWAKDWPTVQTSPALLTGITGSLNINVNGGFSFTVTGTTVQDIVNNINLLGYDAISATLTNGKFNLFCNWPASQAPSLNIGGTSDMLTKLGFTALGYPTGGTFYQPIVVFGTSAQMPLWTAGQSQPHPTGSVWVKVGSAGNGINPVVSSYNSLTASWNSKNVSLATSDWAAIASLDSTGGKAIPAGSVYMQYYYDQQFGYTESQMYLWERIASGPTVVTGTVTDPVFNLSEGQTSVDLRVTVSVPGASVMNGPYTVTINAGNNAIDFVTAWTAANILYTSALVLPSGAIQLIHTQGGVIDINDNYPTSTTGFVPYAGFSSNVLMDAGFVIGATTGVKYGPASAATYLIPSASTVASPSHSQAGALFTVFPKFDEYTLPGIGVQTGSAGTGYSVGDTITIPGNLLGGSSPGNDLILKVADTGVGGAITGLAIASLPNQAQPVFTTQLSNWVMFDYIPNEGAPTIAPLNNTNWFWSTVDYADIMVNTSGGWSGYGNVSYDSNGFPLPSGTNMTDPNGPIISATMPTTQSDGVSMLEYGDLWIDTSDLENYPLISRWQLVGMIDQWVLLDDSNQTSSTGVLFADARWATNGNTNPANDPIPTIQSLLVSNYLDLDAPDHSLYPTGMLLFNTRRSSYNIKRYAVNYFNSINFPDEQSYPEQTDAWVSESGLQSNGAPYMGRKAQRNMVVKALRSVIDTNTDIRDEDNFFNLIATPYYPELQPNMVVLNADRGDTGYILGDTPMRLPANATAIQAWATNAAGATSTGEEGCVTRDTYLGLFYPSGITSDLSGNLVAVPPSHMMLRTFIRNDTNAYPWLAAAGTRRGIIDNATNIGYLDATTGEFVTTKTNVGIRDVLYINFINPLVFFTGIGLLNYGNKTSYNSQSALDRTNVARLIAYIRRQLTIAARPFVFEPNDALTRKQIAGVIQSLMVDLVAKRGLYDYLVICDESNNTPARIDRSELWVDVAIEPVKAAEFIYIPVRVLNTGGISAL